ncbi:MAG: hypothetical protein U0572_02935 [Phycisphaerales bacterium]
MTDEIGTPAPTPSVGAQRFARGFIWFTAIASVATFIWGWTVVNDVRKTAAETDRRIRTLAWATLAYANEFGQFPESDDELRAFGVGPDALRAGDRPKEALWPARRTDALRSEQPVPIDDCLRSIIVVWGDARTMPPLLQPDQLPTLRGTEDEVHRWLEAYRAVLVGH